MFKAEGLAGLSRGAGLIPGLTRKKGAIAKAVG
jgi:hypothetical protein